MVKADIYCGMLGTGKTTLIKQMLKTAYRNFRVAIIENEIGKVNLDSLEFEGSGLTVKPLTAGCICCTVKGDLTLAIREILQNETPDYIILEPTGAADIRALLQACQEAGDIVVNRCVMVVNARKIPAFIKVAGPFFTEQLNAVSTVYLNFTETLSDDEISQAKNSLLRLRNTIRFISTPLQYLTESSIPEDPLPNLLPEEIRTAGIEIREAGSGPMPMSPGKRTVLYTWTWTSPRCFTDATAAQLPELLTENTRCRLWRVKGRIKKTDGTWEKIDLAMGDTFRETVPAVHGETKSILVFIGPKLDTPWLEQKLAAACAFGFPSAG